MISAKTKYKKAFFWQRVAFESHFISHLERKRKTSDSQVMTTSSRKQCKWLARTLRLQQHSISPELTQHGGLFFCAWRGKCFCVRGGVTRLLESAWRSGSRPVFGFYWVDILTPEHNWRQKWTTMFSSYRFRWPFLLQREIITARHFRGSQHNQETNPYPSILFLDIQRSATPSPPKKNQKKKKRGHPLATPWRK